MQIQDDELRVQVRQEDVDESTASSRSPPAIQRNTLTLAFSAATLMLAFLAALVSLIIYKTSLQELQVAQTGQAQMATALAEAQTALTKLEGQLAAAQADLVTAEARLKRIDATWAENTIGDKNFQQPVIEIFQVGTSIAGCVLKRSGESEEAFRERCRDKNLWSTLGTIANSPALKVPQSWRLSPNNSSLLLSPWPAEGRTEDPDRDGTTGAGPPKARVPRR